MLPFVPDARHRSLAEGKYADEAELKKKKEESESLQRSAFAQQKLLSLISHHIRGPFEEVRLEDVGPVEQQVERHSGKGTERKRAHDGTVWMKWTGHCGM